MLGQYEQSLDECAEAHRIAAEIGARREICIAALMQALALIFLDPESGLRLAEESIETSRAAGFMWAEGIASTVAGILHAVTADPDSSQARHSEALEIQRRLGDWEGAGMSLGGLAQLASGRGDTAEAIELYRRSLAAFEAVGDRGEEARILSEMAWTHLADGDPARARATFFESVQAHTDVASVRGVGLSLIGLAATEVAEHRPGKRPSDRRGRRGVRPGRGHSRHLHRGHAGARVRRSGARSASRRRGCPSDRGRSQAHDQRSTRPGPDTSDGPGVSRR